MVHSELCHRVSCNCPKRLAAGTVDSLLAIFNNIGRFGLTLKSTLNMFTSNKQGRLLFPARRCLCFFLSLIFLGTP